MRRTSDLLERLRIASSAGPTGLFTRTPPSTAQCERGKLAMPSMSGRSSRRRAAGLTDRPTVSGLDSPIGMYDASNAPGNDAVVRAANAKRAGNVADSLNSSASNVNVARWFGSSISVSKSSVKGSSSADRSEVVRITVKLWPSGSAYSPFFALIHFVRMSWIFTVKNSSPCNNDGGSFLSGLRNNFENDPTSSHKLRSSSNSSISSP